jgi:hypothetical protein
VHNRELEKLKEQFYIIQAEVKLKSTPQNWDKDQVEALKWAEQVFEKMDPHAKRTFRSFKRSLRK